RDRPLAFRCVMWATNARGLSRSRSSASRRANALRHPGSCPSPRVALTLLLLEPARVALTLLLLEPGGSAMAARSLGSGTISFGLVAIPIRLYPAAVSKRVSFHLLHAKCGNRINYQAYCSACDQVVDRRDLVNAYEFAKGQYVRITDDELQGLEG